VIKKGKCMLIETVIPGDRSMIKKEDEKILRYKDLIKENSAHVECESKSNTGNNRGDWNHFTIIQTIPEKYAWKARN
jgi:uncharacterized protein YaaR (DUF327 family)